MFLVPYSIHPWFAPYALGQAFFLPWCCRVPGMPTCSGCSAQCTLCWHVRATCSSARHRWHVTGMPPGCGGQPRACPSLQLAAARPRAAEEEGWMGTGREARRGMGGAVGRNPLSRPAPARATHRRPETLAQAQQMGPWLAYVRWPIGKYLDNDVEDGPGDI